MNDTQSKIEATITYILGLIWQQGEALRAATPRDTGKHSRAIGELADALRSLVYARNNVMLSLGQAGEGEPQPEPQDAPEEEASEESQEQE